MQARRRRSLWAIAGSTSVLLLICSMPLAAQSGCQTVTEAMTKVITTPSHLYSAMTDSSAGSKPHTTEIIYAGGSSYVKLGAKWTKSEISPQQVLKKEQENRQNSKYTCQYLRDEPVNGEIAAIYGTHAERSDIVSDGQIWISKSRGLPLRHEEDISIGGKDKNHHSTRYEYGDIRPPHD